ncbi:DNA-directed DNA polymerase [Tanacetum coccineum]
MDAILAKEKVSEEVKHEVVVFSKATSREYCEHFMRFSTPCDVEGNRSWDAEINLAYVDKYMSEEMLNTLGFIRLDYGDYGRKMTISMNEEPSIAFGRNFLVATKSQVDFGLGEMRIDITMLKEDRDVDTLLENLVEDMVEIGEMRSELVKIEKILEALDRKYKELEEEKPILKVLDNYMVYRKKLDEVLMGRARLENKDFTKEERERIVENGLPKKLSDLGNFVLPTLVNGTTHLSALADTGASISVLPYSLYKNIGLTDFLVLDILVDRELPLLLGRPFLRTCGALIDMGRGTMTIDDGVIKHTYYPKPRAKAYLESFEIDEDEDWLSCFEVGRDKDGNPKYGLVAPSFLDIEDEMEREFSMEAYFNPFKNIIVFKKLIDFLGSLPVQLKNNDWCRKGMVFTKRRKEMACGTPSLR